jgi:hypothetical protein
MSYKNLDFLPTLAKLEYVLIGLLTYRKYMSLHIWKNINVKKQYLRELVAIIEGNHRGKYDWSLYPNLEKAREMGLKVNERLARL